MLCNHVTYRIIKLLADVKLSLAASHGLIKSAEQLQCATKITRRFSFTSLVTNYPSHTANRHIRHQLS